MHRIVTNWWHQYSYPFNPLEWGLRFLCNLSCSENISHWILSESSVFKNHLKKLYPGLCNQFDIQFASSCVSNNRVFFFFCFDLMWFMLECGIIVVLCHVVALWPFSAAVVLILILFCAFISFVWVLHSFLSVTKWVRFS